MLFCPKCHGILTPKKSGRNIKMVCTCGFTSKKKENMIIKEKMDLGKRIEVIDKKVETLPKTREKCPKCNNEEAYWWIVQTRSADEAATRFFKCTKCSHTWREYK